MAGDGYLEYEASDTVMVRVEAVPIQDMLMPADTARVQQAEGFSAVGGRGFVPAGSFAEPAVLLASQYYEQHFHIHITLDDMAGALQVINGLDGYSLHTNVNYHEFGSNANINRRVDIHAYDYVRHRLRELGNVAYESENVYKRSDEVSDLEARLAAKTEETRRLTELLAASHTMDVLAMVERRLGAAETERDDLRGRLNQIYAMCAQPIITIFIHENLPEPAILPEDTFYERLNRNFIRSLNSLIRFMENALVFISGAVVPLLLLAAVALPFGIALKRRKGKGEKNE
jgi:hypothetical protein